MPGETTVVGSSTAHLRLRSPLRVCLLACYLITMSSCCCKLMVTWLES